MSAMTVTSALALLVLGTPAHASDQWQHWDVHCRSTGQRCDNTALVKGPVGPGTMIVRAPTSHCSNVEYTVRLYNSEGKLLSYFDTGVLRPGERRSTSVRQGAYARIFATGVHGGCNQGRLAAWGVDALVPRPPPPTGNLANDVVLVPVDE